MNTYLEGNQIVLLCSKALRYYDERLVSHGERVAYIACKIMEELKITDSLNQEELYLASIFHDIGAYKTEDINNLLKFETADVHAHSVYGYLFTKYLTPLSNTSEAILYHHTPISHLESLASPNIHYTQLINLADRIDIGLIKGYSLEVICEKAKNSLHIGDQYLSAFESLLKKGFMEELSKPSKIMQWSHSMVSMLHLSKEDMDHYLEMIIYSMEFKSPVTMLHSVNTTTISVFLGEQMNLSESTLEKLYYAALVHDIGKIAIPESILEFKGKLDDANMKIMRTHASYTEEMLEGLFHPEIVSYAMNHHEKLDGSGYPNGLSAMDLSIEMRIVAIADITSALISKRSYKENYDWTRTISILEDMAGKNQLDAHIVDLLIGNIDKLQEILDVKSKPVEDVYHKIFSEYEDILARWKMEAL